MTYKQKRHIAEQKVNARLPDREIRQKFYNEMLEHFGVNGLKDISDKDFTDYVNKKLK